MVNANVNLLSGFTVNQDSQNLPAATCVHTVRVAQDLDAAAWVEYDAGALLGHDCNDSWWSDVRRDTQNTALMKTVTGGLGSDFFHEFTLNMFAVQQAVPGVFERICPWAAHLEMTSQDYYAQDDLKIAALVVLAILDEPDEYQLRLIEKGGDSDTMLTHWVNFQDRYMVIYKEGTKLIALAYQDAAHTILEDRAEITLSGDLDFLYVSMPMSWGVAGAGVSSGLVDPVFGSFEQLSCGFTVRRQGSQDLGANFTVLESGSADLKAALFVRNADSQELAGEVVIRRSDSENLPATFDVNYWYHVSHLVITVGSIAAGTVDDTRQDNGVNLELNETIGAPAFDYEFHFENVPTGAVFGVRLNGYYDGTLGHPVDLYEWNFNVPGWDLIGPLPEDVAEQNYVWMAGGLNYVSGGEFRLRLFHGAPGNVNHDVFIDYLWLDEDFAESENFLAHLTIRQPGSANLLAGFSVRHPASAELGASFDGQVSLNIPAEFSVRRSWLEELPGEFVAAQGSQSLAAKFIVRPVGSANLLGTINIIHFLTLAAEFEMRNSSSENLAAELIVRHPGSEDLAAAFSVFAATSTNLLGGFISQVSVVAPVDGVLIAYDPRPFFNIELDVGTGFIGGIKEGSDKVRKVVGEASMKVATRYEAKRNDSITFGWKYHYQDISTEPTGKSLSAGFSVVGQDFKELSASFEVVAESVQTLVVTLPWSYANFTVTPGTSYTTILSAYHNLTSINGDQFLFNWDAMIRNALPGTFFVAKMTIQHDGHAKEDLGYVIATRPSAGWSWDGLAAGIFPMAFTRSYLIYNADQYPPFTVRVEMLADPGGLDVMWQYLTGVYTRVNAP